MWPFSRKQQPSAPNYRLYTSCEELPLYLFRKCMEAGDLTPLVIFGTPPVEAVAEAWGNIYAEYIDLSGDNDVKALSLLKRDYTLLNHKISKTETSLNLLEMDVCNEEQYLKLVGFIKEEGFVFERNYETGEAFLNAIKRVRNRLSPLKLQLATMEKELLTYESGVQNNAMPDSYFLQWLVCLQKYGYRDYNTANKALTVAEFVLAIKDYLRYVSEHNKQLNYGKEKHDK